VAGFRLEQGLVLAAKPLETEIAALSAGGQHGGSAPGQFGRYPLVEDVIDPAVGPGQISSSQLSECVEVEATSHVERYPVA